MGARSPLSSAQAEIHRLTQKLRESEQRFAALTGSLVDVTARQRDAIALRRSEQHFRAVFDQAAIGIAEADMSGRYLLVNDRYCAIVGYSAEELQGKAIWDITHPEDQSRNQALFTGAISGQENYEIEKRYIRKDGSVVWVHNSVSFIPGPTRAEDFLIAIVEDITARKQAQDDLRRAKQEAEDANAAKDQFLAVLSHELRTPLTPVLTTVHLLGMDPSLSAELRPLVQMIRRNVELEARLIDDLLDLTRISKGKLRLSFEMVDAHAALRSVIDICRPDMAEKAIGMIVDLDAVQHHVRADPARLQQVFWNLLKNAVKFTPAGGSIAIRTRNQERSGLIVEIADTGIGIEPDNLARIFFAFEQLEQSIARRFGGLGLGLAISKSLVDMHGGKLSASSPGKGQGATFTVGLQTAPMPLEQKPLGASPSVKPGGRNIRILMVDDHEDTSRAMKRLLEQVGYEVHTKHTVREALDAANATRYDLLISDIGLPDGSGVDLIRQLRHHANDIRAVALSGFGMDEDIRRSKEAGFHDHLTKPVNFTRLQEVISELTGEK
jgi:two-component system CheB/CheR fusion protein